MAGFIAFACAVIVCVLGTKFLVLHGSTKDTRFRERAEKSGCVAEGRFLDSEYVLPALEYRDYSRPRFAESSVARPWTYIDYEYFVDGQPYRCQVGYPERLGVVRDHPHVIKVYYDQRNPAKHLVGNVDVSGKQKQSGCYWTIFLTIVTFGVVINIMTRVFGL